MSYLALNPSIINDNDEIIGNYGNTNNSNMNGNSSTNKPRQLRNSNNKTVKKKYNQNVQNMLQTINNSNANANANANANRNINANANNSNNAYANEFDMMENENEPADFNPPNYAELTKTPNVSENNSNGYPVNVTKESFKGLNYSTISNNDNTGNNNEYIKPFITYNNNQLNNEDNMIKHKKDTMLEKLNYMIMLLEEQQNERTDHIMEELILYFFLGIFMIFMVDSFVRSGKYVR